MSKEKNLKLKVCLYVRLCLVTSDSNQYKKEVAYRLRSIIIVINIYCDFVVKKFYYKQRLTRVQLSST